MIASPALFRSFPARTFAAACALFVLSSAAQSDDVQEAARLLRAGQHAQAHERINKVLAAKPRDPQARFLKGLIFAEQGNGKKAINIFLKLTQDFPQLPEPYNNLAVLYAADGQCDKARGALEQSIRTHPSYATAYENLVDVYAKLASQAYDTALQIDSANAGAKNKLALVRELVGTPAKTTAVASAPAPSPAPAPASAPAPAPAAATPALAAAPPPAAAPATAKPSPVASAAPAADAKPAAPKPATASANPLAEIVATANAWAKAWSAKSVDGYLAFYAKNFRIPGGETREAWENARRTRITAPKSIAVDINAPKVTLAGDSQTSVTFRQSYKSDITSATTTKTMVLVKANGRRRIQQERVGN